MTDWRHYLVDKDKDANQIKKKKKKGPGCKRNKINRNRLGPCFFNEKDQCVYCSRPRRKVLRMDATTNTIVVEYLE